MLELCRCPNIYGPDCNSGGDHLDPAICPFEGFLERRGVPPNLMGPPKILYHL